MSATSQWIERASLKRARRAAPHDLAAVTARAACADATQPDDVTCIRNEARASERVRIKAILTCGEAAGREDSAAAFAFDTGIDAAAVQALLRGMQLDADHGVDAAVASIVNAGRSPKS